MARGPYGSHKGRPGRLLKRQREQVSALCADVARMERDLSHEAYDAAEPTLEPTLDGVRDAVARLRHWLGELELLVELEHSQNRAVGPRV